MLHQIPKEQQRILTRHIQEFFEAERGETIGVIAAGQILSFVAFELGPAFYNIGVEDANKVVKDGNEHLETEIQMLKRTINQPGKKG